MTVDIPVLEEEARAAAETLLRSPSIQCETMQQSTPVLDISHSQSVNTMPSIHTDYIVSEELLAGQRLDGTMSNVRRFFCLFVTFDLLFTSLMWLICIMLAGEDIRTALYQQIYHYNINSSLFDVVLAAVCRFTVLLLFYALLYVNHWCIIAISTTLTCAFLIAKVFVYDWTDAHEPAFEVLLILTSFILSWGEAWFLDFKVLPQESYARRYLVTSPETERTPLIRSYVQGLPSLYTESVGNFYSPLQSPEGSLYRNEPYSRRKYNAVRFTSEQEDNLRELGKNNLEEAWMLSNHPDWELKKQNSSSDRVHILLAPKYGKVFRLTTELDISPRYLLDELFYKVDSLAQWNPTILESHKIQPIDEHTDITYQVSAPGGAGAVSSRDFVTLRHWVLKENCYVIACSATEHPSLPKNDKYIRGENGVGCFVMRPVANDRNKCEFQWVLNTNLKGWIPRYILDAAFISLLFDYVKYLKQHIVKLRESGKLT